VMYTTTDGELPFFAFLGVAVQSFKGIFHPKLKLCH